MTILDVKACMHLIIRQIKHNIWYVQYKNLHMIHSSFPSYNFVDCECRCMQKNLELTQILTENDEKSTFFNIEK